MKSIEIFNAYTETSEEMLKGKNDKYRTIKDRDTAISHAFSKLDQERHNIQAYKHFINKYFKPSDNINNKLGGLSILINEIECHHKQVNIETVDEYADYALSKLTKPK